MTDQLLISTHDVPNIGTCALYRFIFTVGLLIKFDANNHSDMYYGRYCYENLSDAKDAIETWDGIGDPPGPWIKYKGTDGERSNRKL